MKVWYVEIEYLAHHTQATNLYKHNFTIPVFANNRHEAMLAGLDVGQAVSRSANNVKEGSIYFRVLGINEQNV